MIFGILFQIVFIGLIVLGIRRLRAGSGKGGIRGESVRRFFQFLILFGLVLIVAIGLSGLLARWIESSDVLVTDQTALARNVSFVVVGVPLLIAISLWIRRQYEEDKSEAESFSWAVYFTLATLTLLMGASLGLRQSILWAIGQSDYQSQQVSQFFVWGVFWAGHWLLNKRLTPVHNARAHNLLGSLYGLVFFVVGLIQLLRGTLERLFHLVGDSLFVSSRSVLVDGAITLLVGFAIWFLYWIRTASNSIRDVTWLAYVLLIGVGGGLVMTIASLSTFLYNALVWLVGNPGTEEASIHFRSAPTTFAAAVVGGFIWIYHSSLLHHGATQTRTEVRRVYEYVISAIGLIASAIGFAIVLVSLVDAFTESGQITGGGSRNTLLAAVTLLIVGGPIWWIFWSRIQRQVALDPKIEHASPSRRIYLFVLFGVGGITAVVTLLVGVFMMFDDIFKGNFGEETLRRIRIPIGLILSTAGVSGYHLLVYRGERVHYEGLSHQRRTVLLIGTHDAQMVREISERCTAKVEAWDRISGDIGGGGTEEIIKAILASQGETILVMHSSKSIEVIPIKR